MSKAGELDIQLELKERLPYNSILTASLLNVKKAMFKSEINQEQIQTLILDFFTDIPLTWYDNEFREAISNCITTREVQNRPTFAGVPLDDQTCEELSIATTRKIEEIDYFALKNAIINLLDRLNLLIRKEKIEYSTGVNLRETLEELGEKYDEQGIEDLE